MHRDPKLAHLLKTDPSDPPRLVPLSVRLRNLLGGFYSQFGWLFFGFGLCFVWLFGGTEALRNTVFFSGTLEVVEGTVTDVIETNVSINEQRVFEYRYVYRVGETSYTGSDEGLGGRYEKAGTANIEYAAGNHAHSRIQGMTAGDSVFVIAAIFPVIGLVFIVIGLRRGFRGARLLRDGKQATGVLISRESTTTRVNRKTVYKFTFEFEADDELTYEVIARTHVTERFSGEHPPDQDAADPEGIPMPVREPLLYNPQQPSDAVMLDDLPGGPRINERGEIEGRLAPLIPLLIVPVATVVGHAWWPLQVLKES